MITFVPIDGQIYAKTKKSFFSDVAISCQNDFGNNPELINLVTSYPMITFIFEYTTRKYPIVIDYGSKPQLTLLAARFNGDGEYLYRELLGLMATSCSLNIVKKYDNLTIFDAINETHNEDSDIEGFVAVLKTGQRVKLKCDPYLAKHRVLDEFNAKNLATLIAKDLHDDLKPVLSPERKNILENLEKIILKELEIYSQVVYNLVSEWEGKSLREIGTNYGKHPQFNPAINIFKQLGDNDDIIVQHYLKHRVENFSTKPLW
jgi:hypothetical protein